MEPLGRSGRALALAVLALLPAACGFGGGGGSAADPADSAAPAASPSGSAASGRAAAEPPASSGEAGVATPAEARPDLRARTQAACGEALDAPDRAFLGAAGRRNLAEQRYARAEASLRGAERALRDDQAQLQAVRRSARPALDAFDAFLAAHPEQLLSSSDYARYTTLRAAANAADSRVEAGVAAYNRVVDRYNRLVDIEHVQGRRSDRAAARAVAAERRWTAGADRCLARLDAWDDTVAGLEARLADAVRPIATATVHCDAPRRWQRDAARDAGDGFDLEGYVPDGSDDVHLSPRTCLGLAAIAASPATVGCVARDRARSWACRPSASEAAYAVMTLAHEAFHASGEDGEARAECFALQRAHEVAAALGVAAPAAARIGTFTHRRTEQPKGYRSAECRPGGALDLEPDSAAWP